MKLGRFYSDVSLLSQHHDCNERRKGGTLKGFFGAGGSAATHLFLSLGQKGGSQEAQPPGWELRQRRERKEFEIQIKSNQNYLLFSGPHPLSSNAGQLKKIPESPPFLP
jgi:hypothetical protein